MTRLLELLQAAKKDYSTYLSFLVLCNLKSLFNHREKQALEFGKKCIEHPSLKRIFPENPIILDDPRMLRIREAFKVSYARTEAYNNSAVPAIQLF